MVEPFSDEQVETAHSALMSPLAWDLAHIAAYEDLWLVHRHGGEPPLHPELAPMYDAFQKPRAPAGGRRAGPPPPRPRPPADPQPRRGGRLPRRCPRPRAGDPRAPGPRRRP